MSEETTAAATTASRQRRKRKWDQPAEALVSAAAAMPSLLPFNAAGALDRVGTLPGVFPYMNYIPAMAVSASLPGAQSATSQVASTATVPQNAAAIVQKFNQDMASKGILLQAKIQDELIAREITINDAESGIRYRLTKRQTQEEIQFKTGAVVITRGRYRPPNGPPPGPVDLEKPLYLHISAGVNLKDTTERVKSVDQAAAMVEEMLKQGQQGQLPVRSPVAGNVSNGSVPAPATVTVVVGFEADPSFNLVGRIRGPNDQYINHIMTETGASVVLRGRGSGNRGPAGEELQQPLHLLISSDNQKSVDEAKILAENLLETIRADSFVYRSPSYMALPSATPLVAPATLANYPPPQQAPYQVTPPQAPYTGYHPPFGGPLPYAANPSAYPPYSQTTVPAPLDPSVVVNPYLNMLPPPTKVYAAVPPPTQLLMDQPSSQLANGSQDVVEKKAFVRIRERFSQSSPVEVSSSTLAPSVTAAPTTSGRRLEPSRSSTGSPSVAPHYGNSPPQFLQQHVNGASTTQPSAVPGQALPAYPQAFAANQSKGLTTSSYGGYSSMYPEVSPLQQVAQALQRPPLPVSVKPVPNSAMLATLTKAQSSSFQDQYAEKPAQRRKFKEFPLGGKDSPGNDEQQGRRGLSPSGPDASTGPSHDAGNSISPPTRRAMPPPPPKYVSSAMSKAIPSSSSVQSKSSVSNKTGEEGLKLVEYGEEEEESSTGDSPPSSPQRSTPFSNGKPFWAA